MFILKVQLAFKFKRTGYSTVDDKLNSIYKTFITRVISELRKIQPNVLDNENGKLVVEEIMMPEGYLYKIIQTKKYASYFETGTGIYGPTGRLIQPVNEKLFINQSTGVPVIRIPHALHWSSGGNNIFAKSSKGIKPTHPYSDLIKRMPQLLREVMSSA